VQNRSKDRSPLWFGIFAVKTQILPFALRLSDNATSTSFTF
jgi:hypothetical protein